MQPPRTVYRFVPMQDRPGVYRFHMEAGADGAGGELIAATSDRIEGEDIARNMTAAYEQGMEDARAALRLALGMGG